LSGPAALTAEQTAETLAAAIGRPVQVRALTPDAGQQLVGDDGVQVEGDRHERETEQRSRGAGERDAEVMPRRRGHTWSSFLVRARCPPTCRRCPRPDCLPGQVTYVDRLAGRREL
jgi:hypothetical protein